MEINLEELEKEGGSPFIQKFEEFFNLEYRREIERVIESYPENKSIIIDFKRLEKFNPELADELIEDPDALIDAASAAIQNVNVPSLNIEEFKPHIRITNLPKDSEPHIKNLSATHLNKLICIEGVVRQITDVLPKLMLAVWKCKRCGNVYRLAQTKQIISQPKMCECHHRDFDLVEEQSGFIDYQKIQIQEPLENLRGNEQASYIDVYVSDDLVNRISAGDKTKFTGVLRLLPPQKDKKNVYGRFLEALYLEETEKEFEEVDITREEEEEIKKLSKNPNIYDMLQKSIAPAIYGHEVVKESIALQLFGGVTKYLPNEQRIRGNAHILLMGDPGCGKSQLLQATNSIAPKSIYITGKTSSGVGLCVAPETNILNDSGFKTIEEFVEGNFVGEGKEEIPGCFSNDYVKEAHTLGETLKIQKGNISKIWRIKAPKKMLKIKSNFGKELSLTPNTSLVRIKEGKLEWIKASEIEQNDFVACARSIPESSDKKIYSIKLLQHNKNILIENNISKIFKKISDDLIKKGKYKNLTELAKKIGKNRNTVYSWRIQKHYHGIPLKTFIELGEEAEYTTEQLSKHVKRVFVSHGHSIKLPQTINSEKMAYLTGIILGDGSVYLTDKTAQIRLCNESPEVISNFDSILKNLFDIKTEKYFQKGLPTRRFSSIIIYSLLKEFGLSHKKTLNKISHTASNMNNKYLSALLKGLFDTDGFVATTSNPHVGISTVSKDLAQTTQLALLKYGIISKLRLRKVAEKKSIGKKITVTSKLNQYYIEFRGENAKTFEQNIGFKIKNKHKALTQINSRKTNPNLDIIPEINSLLKHKKIPWNFRKGKNNPSRKKLKELAAKTNDEKLQTLADSDIMWEQIVKVSSFEPSYKYVYDFTVDENHNFIANGFITHNTASAVKDDFGEGGWTLKAGALVLSSGGVCMADELDKMDAEDRSALHEAMEQGMISVAKAGLVTRFKADTSLLAAANPKFSRFDKFTPFMEQINLPPTLVSRFDLFFMIHDVLDRAMDEKISNHILKTHQSGEKLRQADHTGSTLKKEEMEEIEKITIPSIDGDLLRKYVSFARQRCFPVLSEEAMVAITDFYIGLRDQGRNDGAYAATARQLEGLVRLSEASARVRLSNVVEIKDAEKSISLVKASLQDTVVDPETGKIDIDIVTSGTTHSKQNAISNVLHVIKEAMSEGIDMVPIEQIIEEAGEKGIEESKVIAALEDLEKRGEIYKPRHHHVKPTHMKG